MGTVLKTIANFRNEENPDFVNTQQEIKNRCYNGRSAMALGLINASTETASALKFVNRPPSPQ
jgi:hypothetical protein